jgi:tetratricopeptide (TPR) repeat protein
MRVRSLFLAAAVFAAAASPAGAQEWRGGKARVDGIVKNEKGEPVEGCKVALRWGRSGRGGPDLTSDKKGRWAIFGLVGGPWDLDFECPGYQAKKISVELQEAGRNPSVETRVEPQVQAPAAASAEQAILVDGKKISKETAAAIEAGNAAMNAGNWTSARENYVRASAELPENSPLLQRIAAAYLGEGNKEEALKYARMASEKNPQETAPWQMIAELELEKGNADAGLAALDRIPAERVADPALYINGGVLLYNKKKLTEAEAAFDKALAVKPDATAYYYRGLTRYQQKRTKEAKGDFQKALELDPNGPDAGVIKDLLKSIP